MKKDRFNFILSSKDKEVLIHYAKLEDISCSDFLIDAMYAYIDMINEDFNLQPDIIKALNILIKNNNNFQSTLDLISSILIKMYNKDIKLSTGFDYLSNDISKEIVRSKNPAIVKENIDDKDDK